MQAQIAEALARLDGARLTDLGRAADLQWFAFTERDGRTDVSLHVLCPWRLRTETELLVGYSDYWCRASPDTPEDSYTRGLVGSRWRDVRRDAARAYLHGDAVVEMIQQVRDDVLEKALPGLSVPYRLLFQRSLELQVRNLERGDIGAEMTGSALHDEWVDWIAAPGREVRIPK